MKLGGQGRRPRDTVGSIGSATSADAVRHELAVDWERCAGHGVCAAALGEQVGLDRWGYPTGVSTRGMQVAPELIPAARLAVVSCPAAALRLRVVGSASSQGVR